MQRPGKAGPHSPRIGAGPHSHHQLVDAPGLAGERLGGSQRRSLTKDEAAASLGMSPDSFERYVQPELRLVRRGRLRVFPVEELHE